MKAIDIVFLFCVLISSFYEVAFSFSPEYIGCYNDGADDAKFSHYGYGGYENENDRYGRQFSTEVSDGNNGVFLTKDECVAKAASDMNMCHYRTFVDSLME
jgi:hypothetical protein